MNYKQGKKEFLEKMEKREMQHFPRVVKKLLVKIMSDCLDAGYKFGKEEGEKLK